MAKIVEITNPLTGQPQQVIQSDYTAQQIDDAVAAVQPLLPGGPGLPVNQGGTGADTAQLALVNLGGSPSIDLFDNSDFRNPVNQRGVKDTVVQSGGFILDRWTVVYDSGAAPKYDSAGFLSLDNTSGTGNLFLTQKIPQEDFGGETGCTISLFCKSGFYFSPIAVGGDRVYMHDSKINAILTVSDGVVSATVGIATGQKEEVIAAKLNVGNIQTQAYQRDGQWHLFETSNYAEQLARCQRYFRRFPARYMLGGFQSSTVAVFRYPCDPPMRTTPVITLQNASDLTDALDDGKTPVTPSSVVLNWASKPESIGFYFSGASPNTCCVCDRYVDASADL